MRRALVLAVALSLVAVGCGSEDEVTATDPTGPAADDLAGRTFISQAVEGRVLADGGETIRLTFDEDRLGVQGGCNQMSGEYAIEGSMLRWVGEPVSTMMGCSEELMAQDTWLMGLLVAGVDVALEGPELVLAAGGVRIELLDAQASPPAALMGTVWTLDTLIEGEGASSVPVDVTPPTLELTDDGSVEVFAGCNRGRGPVVLDDDGAILSIGPIGTTRMACPGPAGEVEAQVLAVLDGDVAAQLEGDRLTLTKGDRALGFTAT